MRRAPSNLKSLAVRRLGAAGLDWNILDKDARQIIVFGSRALSAARRKSDLDILCIGNGRRFKSDRLHLIWISEERIRSKKWLRSELATHVAAYGKWIKGRNTWAYQTTPSLASIVRKKENILARLNALQRHWDDLLPKFQKNQLTKLRRDIQRYKMMRLGLAPVSKIVLDAKWKRDCGSARWSNLLGTNSDIARRVRKFLDSRGIANR